MHIDRGPIRLVRDPFPSFSSVAVDMERNEVVAGDENLFQILVYDRLANTPPGARMTEPRRVIAGDKTGLEFVCGLHVDQTTGDIYVIHADTAAVMQVFARDKRGNVPPNRELQTGGDLRGRGIVVDEAHQELFLASQHNSAVAVFRKQAAGREAPIRLLQGDRTLLANPHGLAIDGRNDLLFIARHRRLGSGVPGGCGRGRSTNSRAEGTGDRTGEPRRAVPGHEERRAVGVQLRQQLVDGLCPHG
jgi:hypothetical protein